MSSSVRRSARGKGKATDDNQVHENNQAPERVSEREREAPEEQVEVVSHARTNKAATQNGDTIILSAAQLQQIIAAATTQSVQAALAFQATQGKSSPTETRLSPFDMALLKQLMEVKMFNGEGDRSWDDFEQEFTNKASMIPNLPKEDWVRMMHSRLEGQALNRTRALGLLLPDGSLSTTSFTEYCTTLRDGLFSEAATNQAKLQKLLEVTQTGKFADPAVFLKEKEKYLNKLPVDCMAGWVKASLAMQGMDPLLIAAISPNPHSQDGQYNSYEELRKAVVATVGLNKMLLPNNGSAASKEGWQKFSKGSSSQPHQSQGSGSSSFNKGHQQKQHQAGPSQPKAPSSGKKPIGDFLDQICSDCGHPGHRSKGFSKCPKHVKKA